MKIWQKIRDESEAIRWTENWDQVSIFVYGEIMPELDDDEYTMSDLPVLLCTPNLSVRTPNGEREVTYGDWLLRDGNTYTVCTADEFDLLFEARP